MIAVNYTNFRSNMKSHLDEVSDNYETLVVTRKENRNVVLMSEESYNNLIENIYVMGEKTNYDWLIESKGQLERGEFYAKKLIEAADE